MPKDKLTERENALCNILAAAMDEKGRYRDALQFILDHNHEDQASQLIARKALQNE